VNYPTPPSFLRAVTLDASDPLAEYRGRFVLPDNVIYLDGNSLGALPVGVAERMQQVITQEWGVGLIRSWNSADWYPAPIRVGSQISKLIGADSDEVVVCDSTSVNLFKVLTSALRLAQSVSTQRNILIAERDNFPTNTYTASSVAELLGVELVLIDSIDVAALDSAIHAAGERLAVVSLTQVNYKSGARYDMAATTDLAHSVGALMVWDLCHSAGAFPVLLNDCDVDFAVGCSYKYLNGGPGAPAFLFVAKRHQKAMRNPLQGWHGHVAPFAFTSEFVPHVGIDRMLTGTASQLGLLALEAALHAFDDVDMNDVRSKSMSLIDLFIELVDEELAGYGFGVLTPRESDQRGSQVALTHEHGYPITQALIACGVIGDFRAPNVLRFGFAPLYLSHVDIHRAVMQLKEIMESGEWDDPKFHARGAVT
jgi:kynureninase